MFTCTVNSHQMVLTKSLSCQPNTSDEENGMCTPLIRLYSEKYKSR